MGIEKTQVRVELTGDEKAIADAKRVERAMNEVEREARQAQAAVDNARASGESTGLRARFGALLGRAGIQKRDEDIVFGRAFKLTGQGFSLRETFKKGQGEGGIRALNTAMWAGLALHGATNIAEQMADLRKELKDATLAEVMSEALKRAPDAILEIVQSKVAGRFWKGAYTTVTGDDYVVEVDESFKGRLNYALADIFGYDTSLEAQVAVQAKTRRRFLDKQIQEELEAKRKETLEEALRKIDEVMEAQIGKLKTDIVRPKGVRLNRIQNRAFQRRHDEAAERRLRQKGQEDKEARTSLLNGEGR